MSGSNFHDSVHTGRTELHPAVIRSWSLPDGDIDALRRTYNATVYYKDKEKNKLVIEDRYAYLNEYKLDTCEIINKLLKLSNVPDPEYSDNIDLWLLFDDYKVDSPEKVEILKRMFSESAVAAIYGSAGVGKSTLINHISHFYEDKKKLYLAHTNPAIDNLKRRVVSIGLNQPKIIGLF